MNAKVGWGTWLRGNLQLHCPMPLCSFRNFCQCTIVTVYHIILSIGTLLCTLSRSSALVVSQSHPTSLIFVIVIVFLWWSSQITEKCSTAKCYRTGYISEYLQLDHWNDFCICVKRIFQSMIGLWLVATKSTLSIIEQGIAQAKEAAVQCLTGLHCTVGCSHYL